MVDKMTKPHQDYLIVANGNFLVKEMIYEMAKDKTIIALSQAADKLFHLGLLPHILLGDFDSNNKEHIQHWGIRYTLSDLTDDHQAYQGNHDVLIIPKKNQNLTDLIK